MRAKCFGADTVSEVAKQVNRVQNMLVFRSSRTVLWFSELQSYWLNLHVVSERTQNLLDIVRNGRAPPQSHILH